MSIDIPISFSERIDCVDLDGVVVRSQFQREMDGLRYELIRAKRATAKALREEIVSLNTGIAQIQVNRYSFSQ